MANHTCNKGWILVPNDDGDVVPFFVQVRGEDVIEVIPGISSMQLAFSRLALPWHDAELLSFHGREPESEKLIYREGRILGFLTDTKNNSRTVPEKLMQAGWPKEAKLAICARLSYDDEEIVRTTLEKYCEVKEYSNCVLVVTD